MSLGNTGNEVRKASYTQVRAGFVMQGTTLTEWCRDNGTRIQNVRAAFSGEWKGVKANELLDRVVSASGAAK